MIVDTDILKRVSKYVEDLLEKNVSDVYTYHNLEHTQDVVEAAKLIGEKTDLDQDAMEVVLLAAWFHDTGFHKHHTDHEDQSKELAKQFLEAEELEPAKINRVVGCIEATKMPQNPKSLEAQVLCDADLYHLSSDQYFEKCQLMREEFITTKNKKFEEREWLEENVKFFEEHIYFTEYARQMFTPNKERNVKGIKKKLKALKKDDKYLKELERTIEKLKAKIAKDNELRPDRGRETMFRTTSKNHLQLSAMADNKANIMISINAIILSIVVSVLIRKFEESPFLIVPTLVLTLVCLLTIVFAILATRPNVSRGTFSKYDIINKKTNLLFFGNFHSVSLDDYEWGMKEMLKDGDYLYSSLIRDIYFLGVVLGRKYKLLRICYTLFMYGFVIAVLSFIIAIAFFR